MIAVSLRSHAPPHDENRVEPLLLRLFVDSPLAIRRTAPHRTTPQGTKETFTQFEALFDQYLGEKGDKVDWAKIKPPPKEMVRLLRSLQAPLPGAIKS